MSNDPQHTRELAQYLAMLAAREPAGGLLEIRYRDPRTRARMRQQFYAAADTRRPARAIVRLPAIMED